MCVRNVLKVCDMRGVRFEYHGGVYEDYCLLISVTV